MTADNISEYADVIDVRDIISRVKELEPGHADEYLSDEEETEFAQLTSLLEDLKGNGGDEQWRGDWYPVTLVRDSYFEDYARELVSDIGDMPREIPSYIEIDWKATARNIRMDYSSVEYRDVTYWYR